MTGSLFILSPRNAGKSDAFPLFYYCVFILFLTYSSQVNECRKIPNTLSDVKSKLETVKGIRTSLEQGQNRLRYVVELKERVILNTEPHGAIKIQEDTDALNADFEKLIADVQVSIRV